MPSQRSALAGHSFSYPRITHDFTASSSKISKGVMNDNLISIRQYFEKNSEALEVMIIKGGKMISVIREDVMGASFIKYFMMKYTK